MKQLLNRFWKIDPKMKPGQTYSQCGEDVIIDYAITRKLKISSPTYLDIGANHPKWLSNTYRFYQRGCYGVCVEPDKELCDRFKAVRKRAYVADLTLGLQNDISKILAAYGYSFDWFLNLGRSRLIEFFHSMPSLDVEIELATERDEFWNRPIDPNDLVDIAFLSVSVPYCDYVVTERFWLDLIQRKGLDKKYGTIVLSNLSQLLELIKIPHQNSA